MTLCDHDNYGGSQFCLLCLRRAWDAAVALTECMRESPTLDESVGVFDARRRLEAALNPPERNIPD